MSVTLMSLWHDLERARVTATCRMVSSSLMTRLYLLSSLGTVLGLL